MSTIYECFQRMALELEKEDVRAEVELKIECRVWERLRRESSHLLQHDVLGSDTVFIHCGTTKVVIKRDPTR